MEEGAISGKTLIVLELAISAILCLGFGFYQLWSLKRDKAKTRAARAAAGRLTRDEENPGQHGNPIREQGQSR